MTTIVKRSMIAAVLIVLLCVFFVWSWVFKKAEASVGTKKADVEMDAGALVKSFESDENMANARYLNKIIRVTGVVDKVTDGSTDISVYLKNKEETSGVSCNFNKSALKKVTFKPGDMVSVKGICNGYLMDVVLNKCTVVK